MLKKILVWGAIAFVIFFIAFRPSAAADAIGTLGDITGTIFGGLGRFFSSLVS